MFEDRKYISYGFYLLGYYSLETDQIDFYSLTTVLNYLNQYFCLKTNSV